MKVKIWKFIKLGYKIQIWNLKKGKEFLQQVSKYSQNVQKKVHFMIKYYFGWYYIQS